MLDDEAMAAVMKGAAIEVPDIYLFWPAELI